MGTVVSFTPRPLKARITLPDGRQTLVDVRRTRWLEVPVLLDSDDEFGRPEIRCVRYTLKRSLDGGLEYVRA